MILILGEIKVESWEWMKGLARVEVIKCSDRSNCWYQRILIDALADEFCGLLIQPFAQHTSWFTYWVIFYPTLNVLQFLLTFYSNKDNEKDRERLFASQYGNFYFQQKEKHLSLLEKAHKNSRQTRHDRSIWQISGHNINSCAFSILRF